MDAEGWVVLIPGAFYLYLVSTSAWLRGRAWFAATLIALAVWSVGFILVAAASPSDFEEHTYVKTAFAALSLLYVNAFFFYLIGGRYVTRTGIWDLRYQSGNALNEYLEQNCIVSPLARMLRAMPMVLVGGLVVLVGLGFWAQSKGLLT
jgi:hypothetical protein